MCNSSYPEDKDNFAGNVSDKEYVYITAGGEVYYSPYFMSPVKGYAVYWDNYSISEFMDTPQELAFQSLGHCADYYFMYGGNADGIIAQVRDLTYFQIPLRLTDNFLLSIW